MTKLLEKAVTAARGLPPDMQDAMARIMLAFAGEEQAVLRLTPEEEATFATSLDQSARGEFASDEAVYNVWAKHGL